MIIVTSIASASRTEFDKTYAIVRSMKNQSPWIEQLPVLAPSKDLFFKYRNWVTNGEWNHEKFRSGYVPQFLREMTAQPARTMLNELYRRSGEGEHIQLCCFCTDETLCHRSIIAGLLQGAGANVWLSSGADYSGYFEQYKRLQA